jgi:hypothetical protein
VADLYKTANDKMPLDDNKKLYIESLNDHLRLLEFQIRDTLKTIESLGDSIEKKEVEKEKAAEEQALSRSKKRKLKNAIPSFACIEDIEVSKVSRATSQTLVVKDAVVDLRESKEEDSDGNDDIEVINNNEDKSSKK